ncbi:DUF2380 domain-containing protein [Bradyrhizobium sp. Ash2021]|uniref:DUF2380 domain-containing protein n=1 Tax=Bradyrhizobium sp. Ash2021 TaxID=2954771 RepID=UPI0028149A4D|nr:DUF2380 domain-containing protein [Bradyrhizobium sp. Ash2021]WMT71760.1 DUF3280 domain-containing protein [Bradyrhizobium sp. Ash2021]
MSRDEPAACRTVALCRSAGFVLGLGVFLTLSSARGEDVKAPPISIAVADFDYFDTSGEPTNQQAEHQARLQAFADAICADLARDGRYRVVTLSCPRTRCAAAELPPAELLEKARSAGANRLLYGGIQKMSTLIQNAKVQVVDIAENKLRFDRLITFRGDTEESWQRAERFIVRDLISDTQN